MTRKEEIKLDIKKVLIAHLSEHRLQAFIFGSQANRKELLPADIDVGIEYQGLSKQELMLLTQELEELNILYPIDLVDFSTCSDHFKKVALRNIEFL